MATLTGRPATTRHEPVLNCSADGGTFSGPAGLFGQTTPPSPAAYRRLQQEPAYTHPLGRVAVLVHAHLSRVQLSGPVRQTTDQRARVSLRASGVVRQIEWRTR